MSSGKIVKSTKATYQRSLPRTKMEQKGKGNREREGRRQPKLGTSGKLLDLGARTDEGEEGGNKRPTLLLGEGRGAYLGATLGRKQGNPIINMM
jgi:hypothetical protein